MRTGAASAVGARCHNENDVTMTIADSWRYGDWRCGHGLHRSSNSEVYNAFCRTPQTRWVL